MPLPIFLGAAALWGAKAAVSVAASYACEKIVESATNDSPAKYACYLIPLGGVGKVAGGVGKAARIAKLIIKKPHRIVPKIVQIAGITLNFAIKAPRLGLIGLTRMVGGLTRAVLSNVLVKLGIFVGLVTAIVSTTGFIVNFNLNVTDNELNKQIEEQIKQFYGLFGSAVGSATGYLMCGALPGTLLFAFNPAVALVVMASLEEEAKSELYGQVAAIGRLTFQTLINAELSRQFMNARRYLKRDPKHPVSRLIRKAMGVKDYKKWGDDNQPSFTIRENVIEKYVQALPEGTKQFTENFLENFTESCIESGFVVANNIDSAIAANVLAQRNIIGNPVNVSIQFNPTLPTTNNQPPQKVK